MARQTPSLPPSRRCSIKKIPTEKLYGLGTDAVAVMTGKDYKALELTYLKKNIYIQHVWR